MDVFTDYLWLNTKDRQEFVRITDEVAAIVKKSAVKDGMVLVSAMHITAGVYVNDNEEGLIQDIDRWLEQLAPFKEGYLHHQTGEDNGDSHLKAILVHHQVILPVTQRKLLLGTWQRVFYAEFDGQRSKRVVVAVMGERVRARIDFCLFCAFACQVEAGTRTFRMCHPERSALRPSGDADRDHTLKDLSYRAW